LALPPAAAQLKKQHKQHKRPQLPRGKPRGGGVDGRAVGRGGQDANKGQLLLMRAEVVAAVLGL
jgi:hypothetical protein